MKNNVVMLYGKVRGTPSIQSAPDKNGHVMPRSGFFRLNLSEFKNGEIEIVKTNYPVISSDVPSVLMEMQRLSKGDMIFVFGTLTERRLAKKKFYTECCRKKGGKTSIEEEGFTTYVTALSIIPAGNAVQDAVESGHGGRLKGILNKVSVSGSLCGDPELVESDGEKKHIKYEIAIPRLIYIKEDYEDSKTDYIWIHRYGDQAVRDLFCLKEGSWISATGYIRAREFPRQVICPYCKEETEVKDQAVEIIALETEYLRGYYEPDDPANLDAVWEMVRKAEDRKEALTKAREELLKNGMNLFLDMEGDERLLTGDGRIFGGNAPSFLFGRVKEAPQFKRDEQGNLKSGWFHVDTAAKGDGGAVMEVTERSHPIVYSANPEILSLMKGLREDAIVLISGPACMHPIKNRKIRVNHCRPVIYEENGFLTFVDPENMICLGNAMNGKEGFLMAQRARPFSNMVFATGTLCGDPEVAGDGRRRHIRFRIELKNNGKRRHYLILHHYGNAAVKDLFCLHKGSMILVAGHIRAQNSGRMIRCPECGMETVVTDEVTEIVIHRTEYLCNYYDPRDSSVVNEGWSAISQYAKASGLTADTNIAKMEENMLKIKTIIQRIQDTKMELVTKEI